MDNNYLQQIQEYLNNNNVQRDSNENISLNKNQLLECFQMLLNSNNKTNTNTNTNENQINSDQTISKDSSNKLQETSNKKLEQISSKPLQAPKNIDDIPIKGGSNFNELFEKELSKEKNNDYNNYTQNTDVQPKFKYIPKKRNDIVSVPTTTKKYKYYSDNFKSKSKKKKQRKECK